jgi:anti-sigma-K factor RskA
MTEHDRNLDDREHCGGDLAAYALGALEPAEAEEVRAHLETCAVCRDELAAFETVVDVLPLSAPPNRVPASLRRRVLREVAAESRASEDADRPAGRPFWSAWQASRPVAAIAVAAVAVALVVAVVNLASSGSGTPARVIQAQVTGQGAAQLRLANGRGELILRGFSPPPAGEIYEVWTQRGKQAPSPTTALFSVNTAGDGDVAVPGNLQHVDLVMVTPEPDGGTKVPTHPPVISASLS